MALPKAVRGEGENRRFGQSEQRAQRGACAHYAESREIEDKRSAVNPPKFATSRWPQNQLNQHIK